MFQKIIDKILSYCKCVCISQCCITTDKTLERITPKRYDNESPHSDYFSITSQDSSTPIFPD
jgi:hypothetical protein